MTELSGSLAEYEVIQIIREAASVAATEVRCMGYRPANEVNITYRMPTHSGRARYRSGKTQTYRDGLTMARTLVNGLCVAGEPFDELASQPQHAVLADYIAQRCGLQRGTVTSKPIKGGFLLTLQLSYADQQQQLARTA